MYYIKAQKNKHLGIVLYIYKEAYNIHDKDELIEIFHEDDKEKAFNLLMELTSS